MPKQKAKMPAIMIAISTPKNKKKSKGLVEKPTTDDYSKKGRGRG